MDAKWWNEHYLKDHTPWDIGAPSKPLVHFFESLNNKQLKILIPGAGRAWEAAWLHHHGFKNVYVCDWAPEPLQIFRQNVPDFPSMHLIEQDFFQLEGQYDLIVEQTFLSALPPEMWPAYAKKTAALLKPGGILAGVVFATPFENPGPPFGAYEETYRSIFEPFYQILDFRICDASILPRKNNEFFMKLTPI